ncbi:MAG: ATP-binding cassette domain-containing protein, partial [Gammaproteobacteria bacterium]
MGVFWQLRGFFRSEARAYLIASLCLLVVAGLLMVPPYLTGRLVDAIVSGSLTRADLLRTLGTLVGIAVTVYVLRVLWRIFLFGASHRLARDLRNQLYAHWTRLSAPNFRHQRIGDLMTRATSDVDAMQMTAGEGVLATFDGLLTGVIVLAVMMTTLSWDLTLVALIPWPVAGLIMYWIGERLHQAFAEGQARYSDLNELTQETLGGLRTVRGLGREALVARRFARIARASTHASLKAARYEVLYTPLIVVVVGLSFLLSVGYGGWKISQGTFTIGQLTSFTMYLGFLIWPAFAFGWMLSIAQRGRAAWTRIQQVLAIEPAITDSGTRAEVERADIQASIPAFDYGEVPVLRDIRLSVPEGGVLGLTGPTGSGKTTLLRLLMRLEEAAGAEIRVGGHPLEAYRLEALRAAIAWVPQEPFLFSASVRENLLLARPDASRADIEAATRLAAIHEDILAFPKG